MMNPLPNVNQAFSLIKQEERQMIGPNMTMSFMANSIGKITAGKDASARNVWNSIGLKKNLKCTFCQKDGHTREHCFKIIAYPPKGRGRGKPGNTNASGFRTFPQAMQVSGAVSESQSQSTMIPNSTQSNFPQSGGSASSSFKNWAVTESGESNDSTHEFHDAESRQRSQHPRESCFYYCRFSLFYDIHST